MDYEYQWYQSIVQSNLLYPSHSPAGKNTAINCQLNLTLITGKINERKSGLNNNLKV